MQTKPFALASCCIAALLLTAAARLPQEQERPPDPGIPIGTVLPWWGTVDAIPAGFELCDGRFPETRGAILKEPKPDLLGRFLKGAEDPRNFRPRSALMGGTNRSSATTGEHHLTVSQIPTAVKVVLDPGADGVTDPGHSHGAGETSVTTTTIQPGDGTPVTVVTGITDPASTDSAPSGLKVDPTELNVRWETSGNAGAAHAHPLTAEQDNQPAYLEILFIVRVK